jgi:phospholipid/cholesterol/gamma-HCH transport system ATP-binding protein
VGETLQVQDVNLELNGRLIFQNLHLHLGDGEYLLVLGDSGSGKSLLLKICAGLKTPDKGRVALSGVDLARASKETLQELRKIMGFVFQDSALISYMAVYDNVALPLRYHRSWSEGKVRQRVGEVLATFGIARELDRAIPAQLSLEMRQRVALARALVLEPRVLFLDQPASGVGTEAEEEISHILGQYQKRSGASVLEVAGELPPFYPPADRIGVLQEGRIVQEGTAAEMQNVIRENRKSKFGD